ncbi:MAG: TolC family protein, partial [Terriglobia bacterium]
MLRHLSKAPDFLKTLLFRLKIRRPRHSGTLSVEVRRCASWVPVVTLAALSVLMWPLVARAGQQQPSPKLRVEMDASQPARQPQSATPLASLIDEAERNNPRIVAARLAWQAAEQVPSQVSTLPDPQFTVQQFAVGSPRPFAGFSNSNFAYIGFGVSQDLPYPGKLRLRGEMARRGAVVTEDKFELVRHEVTEKLKTAYFQASYIQQTLRILLRDQKLLAEIEKIAESRYRVGQGNQQDVLKAQLEQTKLLRKLVVTHEEMSVAESRLRQLLNRPAGSPDIVAEPLTETTLPYSVDYLMAHVRTGNPSVDAGQQAVRQQGLQVELAHKDFYPDFNVQYMWQHTAAQFRDYYMLTFGVRIPIHRQRKQEPELAQA